jgi:hypothetical protein
MDAQLQLQKVKKGNTVQAIGIGEGGSINKKYIKNYRYIPYKTIVSQISYSCGDKF